MTNELKPVYLLAGGHGRRRKGPDLLLEAVFKGYGIKDPAVAYTGTASGDDKDFFRFISSSFTEAGADKVTHAVIAPDNADLKKARTILEENRDALIRLAEVLLEYEVLDGPQIDAVIKGEPMPDSLQRKETLSDTRGALPEDTTGDAGAKPSAVNQLINPEGKPAPA